MTNQEYDELLRRIKELEEEVLRHKLNDNPYRYGYPPNPNPHIPLDPNQPYRTPGWPFPEYPVPCDPLPVYPVQPFNPWPQPNYLPPYNITWQQ